MYRKTIIILSLVILSTSIYAQIDNNDLQFIDQVKQLKIISPGEEKDIYDGSPYLTDNFEPGSIKMTDGNTYDSIPVRYNIYNDQIQFERDGKVMGIENPVNISMVKIKDQSFIYTEYKAGPNQISGYLELLISGDYSLYKRYNIILRAGSEPSAYEAAKKPRFDLQKPEYYLSSINTQAIRIKSGSDIISNFNELEPVLKEYSGKKKLRLKKEEDYFNLVDFINK